MGKIVDSQVEAISFRVVEGITWPSSTIIAELLEIFCTVAEMDPPAVATSLVSPTLHALSQFLVVLLELRYDCENGRVKSG